MRFYEEYKCGCVSKLTSKKKLPGYCSKHGDDARYVHSQAMPDPRAIAKMLESPNQMYGKGTIGRFTRIGS